MLLPATAPTCPLRCPLLCPTGEDKTGAAVREGTREGGRQERDASGCGQYAISWALLLVQRWRPSADQSTCTTGLPLPCGGGEGKKSEGAKGAGEGGRGQASECEIDAPLRCLLLSIPAYDGAPLSVIMAMLREGEGRGGRQRGAEEEKWKG